MRAFQPEADVTDAPENPLAQNAATEAVKPKPKVVPAVGATLDDPNAPPLPGVQPSTSAQPVNIDPNAYAPPPQAAEPAVTASPSVASASTTPFAPTTTTAPSVAAPMPAPALSEAPQALPTVEGAPAGWTPGNLLGVSNGTTRYQNGQISGGTFEEQFARSQAAAEAAARERQMQKEDVGIAEQAQKAMFATKPDGGSAFGNYVATLTPEQRTRLGVQESSVTPTQRIQSGLPQLAATPDVATSANIVPGGAPAPVASGLKSNPDLASFEPGGANANPGNIISQVPQFQPASAEGVTAKPGGVITTQTGGLPTTAPSGYLPPTASGMGNVAQTAVTPENALTNSMISRAPGADRFKIAQDQYKAAEEESAPRYEADLRQAMRKAAAGGALGSGMLQTSIGDIAQNRDIFNRTNRTNLLSEALKGTIADQFGDVGIAQQQQGFQQGQQQQAFGNEVTREQLQEALTNGSFQRALQQLTAGSSGNPADTALLLSQIFGGQASEAGSSLAQLLAGLGQKSTAGGTTGGSSGGGTGGDIVNLLSQLFGGGQKPTTTTPTSTTVYGGQ